MNNARSVGTPAWLQTVRLSGIARIRLQFDPKSVQQSASIMMLARNFWTTDFAITQNLSDVLVYLRRPGTDANGDPAFRFGGVVEAHRWNSVGVSLERSRLRIAIDGSTRLVERVPVDSTRVWGPGQIALGDEVHGGGPWQGRIRLADVITKGYDTNYLDRGELSIPATYFYSPDHIIPFPPSGTGQWLDVLFDLVTFVPVGFVVVWARRPSVRVLSATVLAGLLAIGLSAGKFLFHGRHTSVTIVVMEVFGALLGAALWRFRRLHTLQDPRRRTQLDMSVAAPGNDNRSSLQPLDQ